MSEKLSILIVEDEPLIAMMLEDFLLSLGHEIKAICESVDEGVEAAKDGDIDLAILDVNVDGQQVWPVAEILRDRSIPMVLATGGHLQDPPADFKNMPTLSKPYTIDSVPPVIDEALARA